MCAKLVFMSIRKFIIMVTLDVFLHYIGPPLPKKNQFWVNRFFGTNLFYYFVIKEKFTCEFGQELREKFKKQLYLCGNGNL